MMEAWWRVLKTEFRLPSEFREGDQPVATEFDDETGEVLGSYLYPHLNPDLEDDAPETVRRIIHEDMHVATLPELWDMGQPINRQRYDHIEFPAYLGEQVYEQWLASQGKLQADNPDNPQKQGWQKRSLHTNPRTKKAPHGAERYPEEEDKADPAVLSTLVSSALDAASGHSSLTPEQSMRTKQRYLDRVQGRG